MPKHRTLITRPATAQRAQAATQLIANFALAPLALACAQSAWAQTPVAVDGPQLQEVRINAQTEKDTSFAPTQAQTAGKAPTRLLETPQSISVVTRELMESRQVTNLQQALQNEVYSKTPPSPTLSRFTHRCAIPQMWYVYENSGEQVFFTS